MSGRSTLPIDPLEQEPPPVTQVPERAQQPIPTGTLEEWNRLRDTLPPHEFVTMILPFLDPYSRQLVERMREQAAQRKKNLEQLLVGFRQKKEELQGEIDGLKKEVTEGWTLIYKLEETVVAQMKEIDRLRKRIEDLEAEEESDVEDESKDEEEEEKEDPDLLS